MTQHTHEYATPSDPASRFITALDTKFALGVVLRGGIVRDHQEEVTLVPTIPLDLCPAPERVYATRPIQKEREQSFGRWGIYSRHQVTVFEQEGLVHTDFYVEDGAIVGRRLVAYRGGRSSLEYVEPADRIEPGLTVISESYVRVLGSTVASVDQHQYREFDGPLEPQTAEALLGWIAAAEVQYPRLT